MLHSVVILSRKIRILNFSKSKRGKPGLSLLKSKINNSIPKSPDRPVVNNFKNNIPSLPQPSIEHKTIYSQSSKY